MLGCQLPGVLADRLPQNPLLVVDSDEVEPLLDEVDRLLMYLVDGVEENPAAEAAGVSAKRSDGRLQAVQKLRSFACV